MHIGNTTDSGFTKHDLYPDTRSTVPALTAEEFMEGKNAVPNTQPVNPAAAQAKPKIQVAKKANILNQLAPTASAPPSPRPQQTQQQRRPVIDDDMGIVPMNQARPPSSHQHYQERQSPDRDRPNQMTPKQQKTGKVKVNLRSRADRDDGGSLTAGQRRAAAELERIKRDQARTATEEDYGPPTQRLQATPSPRMSGPTNMEELLSDLAKMKAVMRQHERRIRILEEEIAEKNMSQAYSF
ncbi:hypothetical protein ANCCAN_18061 [Ancylostoma caninum]|uniref:Uncharacterized protein n=1 Tax=Ancylostoma caninum TaxID=29170 RepID=A0A368FVC7_ANCCA|nr:hypothetical protein ANCCAN_18061 [Ancylostoma caninum]